MLDLMQLQNRQINKQAKEKKGENYQYLKLAVNRIL